MHYVRSSNAHTGDLTTAIVSTSTGRDRVRRAKPPPTSSQRETLAGGTVVEQRADVRFPFRTREVAARDLARGGNPMLRVEVPDLHPDGFGTADCEFPAVERNAISVVSSSGTLIGSPMAPPVARSYKTFDPAVAAPAQQYASQANRGACGERSGADPTECRGRQHEGPVAGLSRGQSQWRRPRRVNRDRLVGIAAGAVVAPAHRTRVVVFAVAGDLLYTQEQRGDDELVSCYRLSTGEPVWRHRDAVRFWESNGGAGPRGTPTLSNGRVYAFGATGILNALDAGDRRPRVVAQRRPPTPTGGPDVGLREFAARGRRRRHRRRLRHAGGLRYRHRQSAMGRSRARRELQLAAAGRRSTASQQVLLLSGPGATSVAPADGTLLWEHAWAGSAIVQPALIGDDDLLINTIAATGGDGTRRLAVAHGAGGWTVDERWTSNGLKPYFNDFVVHKGHAFGFDGNILACIDLEDGKRKWKGGRYGNGQLVLLPDQDLLLVLSEEGELALVKATPDQFTEVARFPALDGKTWNHPVLVGDILLVRNGEEMAAFRLQVSAR